MSAELQPWSAEPLVSMRSDIGRTRTENQDRCAAFRRTDASQLIVVADGMGGHRGGGTAAQIAIDRFGRIFEGDDARGETLLDVACQASNQTIWEAAEADAELSGMGSTLVALMIESGAQWIVHLGDSRAYRLRAGQLTLMTMDHSTVMELVRSGRIAPEEAATHPRKNEVLRSLGLPDPVEPEIQRIEAEPGDRYLLCSDGLTGVVSDQDIEAYLIRHSGPAAVDALIAAANAAGGPDNVTVALIEYQEPPAQATASTPGAGTGAGTAAGANGQVTQPRNQPVGRLKSLLWLAIITAILLILMLGLFVMSSVMSAPSAPPGPAGHPPTSESPSPSRLSAQDLAARQALPW